MPNSKPVAAAIVQALAKAAGDEVAEKCAAVLRAEGKVPDWSTLNMAAKVYADGYVRGYKEALKLKVQQ